MVTRAEQITRLVLEYQIQRGPPTLLVSWVERDNGEYNASIFVNERISLTALARLRRVPGVLSSAGSVRESSRFVLIRMVLSATFDVDALEQLFSAILVEEAFIHAGEGELT